MAQETLNGLLQYVLTTLPFEDKVWFQQQMEQDIRRLRAERDEVEAVDAAVEMSMDDVAAFSDMVLVMNQSRVFCFDTVQNVFSRSIELNEMGLNIPSVTEILVMLKQHGYDVDTSIYRMDDAVDMLIQRYQEGALS